MDLGLSNSIKIYKWVPGNNYIYVIIIIIIVLVREELKDEDEINKENEVIDCVFKYIVY